MTFTTEGSMATSNVNNNVKVNNRDSVNVKVQFKDDIRRFILTGAASISLLRARVQTLFSIPADTPVTLLYRDDENDLVTMTLEEEMQHAIQVSKGMLRLEVRIQGEPQAPKMGDWQAASYDAKPWKKMWKHHKGHHMSPPSPFGFGPHAFARGPHPEGGAPHPFGGPGPMPHGPHGHGPMPHGPHGHGPHAEFHGPRHGPHGRHSDVGSNCGSEQERGANKDKLKARHVKDVTIPDGTTVLAGVPFIKTWRVRAVGAAWPAKTRLIFISHKGDHMGGPEFVPIEGPVQGDAEIDISVNLVAPQEPGDYSGFWRMATEDGKKFGQRLWVSITVAGNSSSSEDSGFEHVPAPSEYDELCKRVEAMGFDVPKRRIEHMLRKFGGNVDTVAGKLAARQERQKEGRGGRHGCGGKKH